MRRSCWRWILSIISRTFYIEEEQVPKVLYHGLLLACIIAGFWLLDSLKDPVLSNTVGMEYQPIAKLLSVVTTLIVVCIYDFLTSVVGKPMLFHIVSVVYCIIMLILSALLADEKIGLGNGKLGPDRTLGWITYCLVESYGSLTVTLFWSFTNSVMNLEDAKGAYGLIIAIAQIGAIIGSTFAAHAATITIPGLFILGSIFILSVSLLIKAYHITFKDYTTEQLKAKVRSDSESSVDPFLPPVDTRKSKTAPTTDTSINIFHGLNLPFPTFFRLLSKVISVVLTVVGGFYEGLALIIKYPYVLKLLAVSCVYDIVVVILDFEFKIMGAKQTIHPELLTEQIVSEGHITDRFANLLGHFGQMTNLISLVLSLCGFSYMVHTIGVQNSLLVFPFTLMIAVIVISFVPKIWVLFFFVSTLKGMLFSLHDPAKELLYIPTSEAIKYKAKAWIDVFGSRLAKATGSMITFASFGNIDQLRTFSEIPLLILTAIVIYLTWSIGKDFQDLVDKHRIVGEEYDEASSIVASLNPNHPYYDPHHHYHDEGPIINGLKPGDVGYAGYDPELFEGVWEEDENDPWSFNIDDYQSNLRRVGKRAPSRSFDYYLGKVKNEINNNTSNTNETSRNVSVNAFDYFGKTREELFSSAQNPSPTPQSSSTSNNPDFLTSDSTLEEEGGSSRVRTKSSHL